MSGAAFAFFRAVVLLTADDPHMHHGWHCPICRYIWLEFNPE